MTPDDCVYPYVEKHAKRGSILDLGCGSGSTANELASDTYREYVGVDISDVAISKAINVTKENLRLDKNTFIQDDIFSYVPTQKYDVILFRDSIYYVPQRRIKGMLDRYSKYLKEEGVFIVRLWDASGKRKKIIATIENSYKIIDRYSSEQPKATVLVFH